MHILFWLAQALALVSSQFLEKAKHVQSMVYSKEMEMNTYKGLRRFFLHLLYFFTPRPAGSAEERAGVVIVVHS